MPAKTFPTDHLAAQYEELFGKKIIPFKKSDPEWVQAKIDEKLAENAKASQELGNGTPDAQSGEETPSGDAGRLPVPPLGTGVQSGNALASAGFVIAGGTSRKKELRFSAVYCKLGWFVRDRELRKFVKKCSCMEEAQQLAKDMN